MPIVITGDHGAADGSLWRGSGLFEETAATGSPQTIGLQRTRMQHVGQPRHFEKPHNFPEPPALSADISLGTRNKPVLWHVRHNCPSNCFVPSHKWQTPRLLNSSSRALASCSLSVLAAAAARTVFSWSSANCRPMGH